MDLKLIIENCPNTNKYDYIRSALIGHYADSQQRRLRRASAARNYKYLISKRTDGRMGIKQSLFLCTLNPKINFKDPKAIKIKKSNGC